MLNARVAKVCTCVSVLAFQLEEENSQAPHPLLHSCGCGWGRLWYNWDCNWEQASTLRKEAAHEGEPSGHCKISCTWDKIFMQCDGMVLTTSLLVEKDITQTISELLRPHLKGKHASRVSLHQRCQYNVTAIKNCVVSKSQDYTPTVKLPLRISRYQEGKLKEHQQHSVPTSSTLPLPNPWVFT